MAKHELYDAAVSEVRGEATPSEKALLSRDVFAWRDALQSVIDELDAQTIVKQDEFEVDTAHLSSDDYRLEEAQDQLNAWKGRMRTFKKHITARLMYVKRMCQEEAEGTPSQAQIVSLAVELRQAENTGSDSEFDAALDALLDAVDVFLSGS